MISTNQLGYPQYVLPIGIASVASYIESIGHTVALLDLCFIEEQQVENAIQSAIKQEKPELIGVNIRNYCTFMDNPPRFFLPFIREIVNTCKSVTNAPVVLGGGGYSNNPEEIMEYIPADFGIPGDGEMVFLGLFKSLEGDMPLSDVEGLLYRENGQLKRNPMKFLKDINQLPIVNRDFYDKRYFQKQSELGIKTVEVVSLTRGCPYRCIYCTSKNFYSPFFRLRDPENVVEEIKMLLDRGVEEIQFLDFALNLPIGNLEKVLNIMKDQEIKIKWSGNIHPYPLKSLSKELILLMKETGCIHLDFDTITCSEKVASNLKRPLFSKQAIIQVSEWCTEIGIPFSHYLLIGGPGECKETILETLETIELTNPTASPKVVANVGVVIGSNTELAKIAFEEKILKEDDNLLFPPKFYLSNGVDQAAIEIIGKYMKKYSDWLFVGITLEKHLSEDGDVKEYVSGVKVPNTPIKVGDYFPEIILHDLDKKLVNIKEPVGKHKLILIDSREAGQKVGPWVKNIFQKYAQANDMNILQIAAVEKLRFFVSKDFVLDHIKTESRGRNKLIDWDSEFTSLLGIEKVSEPILILINQEGRVKDIITLTEFSKEALSKVYERIEELDISQVV